MEDAPGSSLLADLSQLFESFFKMQCMMILHIGIEFQVVYFRRKYA
jgi:hypothetical protein